LHNAAVCTTTEASKAQAMQAHALVVDLSGEMINASFQSIDYRPRNVR